MQTASFFVHRETSSQKEIDTFLTSCKYSRMCEKFHSGKLDLHCIAEIRAYWVETKSSVRSTTLDIRYYQILDNLPLFVFMWWEDLKRFLGSGWVEKSRVPASG